MSRLDGKTSEAITSFLFEETLTGPEKDTIKGLIDLGNVDNTSDANKPVSTAQQTALDGKVNNTGNETVAGNKTLSGQLQLTGQTATDANDAITRGLAIEMSRSPSDLLLADDFIGGGTASNSIGALNWYVHQAGGGAGDSISTPNGLTSNFGQKQLTCGNVANAGKTVYLDQLDLLTSTNWEMCFVFSLAQTTDCDIIVGGTTDTSNVGIGIFGGTSFGLRYSSAVDTNFMFFSKKVNTDWAANDANNFSLSTGVAVNTAFHTVRMRSTVTGQVQMKLDAGAWTGVTMVSTSGNFLPFIYVSTRAAESKSAKIDFWSFTKTGLSR